MPCESIRAPQQTEEQRLAAIDDAMKALEAQLEDGSVSVLIGSEGAATFLDWDSRNGITDVCAIRRLELDGSWAWKQARAAAEAMAGRQLDMQAVESGLHTHDGGLTWSRH